MLTLSMYILTILVSIHNIIWTLSYFVQLKSILNMLLTFCVESTKMIDMYLFLFDDILLITRMKKSAKKVSYIHGFSTPNTCIHYAITILICCMSLTVCM